jgi:hypothetical protein
VRAIHSAPLLLQGSNTRRRQGAESGRQVGVPRGACLDRRPRRGVGISVRHRAAPGPRAGGPGSIPRHPRSAAC